MTTTLTARNATPQDLVTILKEQSARKLDVVTPAKNVWAKNGLLVVKGAEAELTEDGVTQVNGTYRPTEVFDGTMAGKLDVPVKYLRRLREDRPDLYDANVNGLLHGRSVRQADGTRTEVYAADARTFLLRLFRAEGGEGVARAMLSDRYGLSMDNLDMLLAVLAGLKESGVPFITRVTNLSENGVHVRFEAPQVNTLASVLVGDYKSPFDGGRGYVRAGAFDELRQQYGAHHMFSEKDAPLVYAGLDFKNNETGGGSYSLYPVVGVLRCTNGLIVQKEGFTKRHIGGQLNVGEVKASLDTVRAAGKLVTEQTKDSVRTWFSKEYLEGLVARLEQKAGTPLATPAETVPAVAQSLGFTQEEQAGILDMFIVSGQSTAGGVANAVSAYAQTVEDPDRALEVESKAIEAMDRAASRR